MCNNINVRLDELRQTLVRTITGGTYFMRSGAKITGKVNERFMLIDGNRVATGSYSSNLIELSGQITENFDEEFRFLYAKSMPVITRGPASARNRGIYGHLLIKHPVTSSPQPARERTPVEPVCLEVLGKTVCLTITPSRAQAVAVLPPREETGERGRKSSPVSDSSTIGEDWMEQQHMQEILAGSAARCLPTGDPATVTVAVDVLVTPPRHVSTQTSCPMVDSGVQTDLTQYTNRLSPNKATVTPFTTTNNQTNNIQNEAASSSDYISTSPRQHLTSHGVDHCPAICHCTAPPMGT
ncbi:protein FAM83D-like isoform X1 [Coregonus clupeaformis]|uniref:protein FAM83D-like isoform X1 n=1 Tax=Coregonus clupeaformis TaxID=59861 RepID=UPI001E1C7EA7|nr:protein FAM83D-like isoform X1 [Coregonus clupeaformis]XP_041748984.2 protein FAM83D-like isoform X1 [Coregonus clupeaformis]